MASTRLPGKPLADIAGTPMIVHVLRRAQLAAVGPVAVACGDPAIAAAVERAGARAILTDPDLPSGSDRVHAALQILDPDGAHDVVINLQGDFPTTMPDALRRVLLPLADPAVDIGTLVTPITTPEEAALASVVKAACVFAADSLVARALYFSRCPIPLRARPRSGTISAYTPIAAPPSTASSA